MQLTVWTYEGPPHVGAMRIATAMTDVHYVLHAPQGDTYADLLFPMIERRAQRPPVTYTTFEARDLGGDTATLVDLKGSEKRILAVIVPRGERTWFYKLTAPDGLVTKERENFVNFVKSVRY